MEPDEIDLKVMNLLLFEETFGKIAEELPTYSPNILADVLKHLIVKGWVTPVQFDSRKSFGKQSMFLETDGMRSAYFRLTTKGINLLEKQSENK